MRTRFGLCVAAALLFTLPGYAELVHVIRNGTWVSAAQTAPPDSPDSDLLIQAEGGRLEIESAPDARLFPLKIFAVDAAGAPIRGALVFVAPQELTYPLLGSSSVVTAADGSAMARAARGDILRITAIGYQPWTSRVGDATEVIAPLQRGEEVSVRFVSKDRPTDVQLAVRRETSGAAVPGFDWRDLTSGGDLREGGFATQRLRVEVIDPRYQFESFLLSPGAHEIALKPAVVITGRIVGSDDEAIVGAEVSALFAVKDAVPPRHRAIRGESADDGAFVIGGLHAPKARLRVRAAGYEQQVVNVVAGVDPPVIRLERSRSIELAVYGGDGKLSLFEVWNPETFEAWRSEDGGPLTLDGLARGESTILRVSAPGHLDQEVEIGPKSASRRKVVLERAPAIRFQLFDALTGDPVEETAIELVRASGRTHRNWSGPEGSYEITLSSIAPLIMTIHSERHRSATVQIPAGVHHDLGAIHLDRGIEVGGLLLTAAGKPLVGAELAAVPLHANGYDFGRRAGAVKRATVGRDGRFLLSGLEPGLPCVTISHPLVGTIPLPIGTLAEGDQHDQGTITVGELGRLEGMVRDAAGNPVRDADVRVRSGLLHSPCTQQAVSTDPDGRFSVEGLMPGPYSVAVIRNHQIAGSSRISVRGDRTSSVEIRLRVRKIRGEVKLGGAAARGGTIEVRPLEAGDWAPVVVMQNLRSPGGGVSQSPMTDIPNIAVAEVDMDGRLAGEGIIEEGPLSVSYRGTDGTTFRTRVASGDAAADLVLNLDFRGVDLHGRVVSLSGAPAGAAVIARGTDGWMARIVRTLDGTFILPQMEDGAWEVEAVRGNERGEIDASVPETTTPLEIILGERREGATEVHLRHEDSGLAGRVLLTNGQGLTLSKSASSDGTVLFDALPKGRYRVFAFTHGSGILDGGTVEVQNEVERVVIEAATTPVRVLVSEAHEEIGRAIQLWSADLIPLQHLVSVAGSATLIDETGRAALPPLEPGRWVLRIGRGPMQTLELKEGAAEVICSPRTCD